MNICRRLVAMTNSLSQIGSHPLARPHNPGLVRRDDLALLLVAFALRYLTFPTYSVSLQWHRPPQVMKASLPYAVLFSAHYGREMLQSKTRIMRKLRGWPETFTADTCGDGKTSSHRTIGEASFKYLLQVHTTGPLTLTGPLKELCQGGVQ
jgi:hypothetical protein